MLSLATSCYILYNLGTTRSLAITKSIPTCLNTSKKDQKQNKQNLSFKKAKCQNNNRISDSKKNAVVVLTFRFVEAPVLVVLFCSFFFPGSILSFQNIFIVLLLSTSQYILHLKSTRLTYQKSLTSASTQCWDHPASSPAALVHNLHEAVMNIFQCWISQRSCYCYVNCLLYIHLIRLSEYQSILCLYRCECFHYMCI